MSTSRVVIANRAVSTSRAVALALATTLVLTASEALACPVCFSPNNEANRVAFEWSTFFLSVIPLAIIGSGIAVLWRRSRKLDQEALAEEAAREVPAVGAGQQEQAV